MIRRFLGLTALLLAVPAVAQQQPAARPHALQGSWSVQRLDQSSRAVIRVDQVFPSRGVTNLSGQLLLAPGSSCPLTGTVIDELTARFDDVPEVRSFPINAFVTFRARCGDREYWIEALGLPSGNVQMNGRMTEITATGRGLVPVSIGR